MMSQQGARAIPIDDPGRPGDMPDEQRPLEAIRMPLDEHPQGFSHSSFVGIVRLVNAQLLQQRISMHGKSALQQSLLSS